MPTGIVKAFYRSRGYGFIRSETDGRDVFFHRKTLEATHLKELRKGQMVTFDVSDDQGRLVAKNLQLIDEEERSSQNGPGIAGEQSEREADFGSDKSSRKSIASASLERTLTAAVRKVAPECEAFVGVIVERIVPEAADGANWAIKGVRYGKADRRKCESALCAAFRDNQQKYLLADDDASFRS
jgi:cold shock CspA family protein